MITLQQVELGVLGPLQVRQYGLPVAIPGAKPRAILTMLGLHGGSVVSADALVELLWGDDPPRTAAKALQTHISSLRRTLGDGFVLTQGTGWTLSTTEIDATRYKVAARLGRDAITAGDAGQAAARFDEALTLWRGVPELPDGPRGTSEKTRWIEGHAALVEDRADALLATGRAAEIVGELEAAVADAPLRERRWGHLMLALYRAGRQGEALGAYQRVRSLLADQLGVDPGPDLRRLEAAIVTQDAALEMPVSQQLQSVTRAVTFLLTDIEGSTAAWEADADAMAVALARHDEIVEQVVTSRGGRLIKTRGEGDATFSVFDRPSAAAAGAIELQEAIFHEPWALAEPMRIRVALHTGEVELRDGDYFGRAVNRAARLRSLAAGGQILCSGATAELVIDTLPDDVVLADLGMRQLKNLPRPEHVFELRLENADDFRAPATEVPIERPGLPVVLAGPGPFVGRGPELERLLSAWQTTLAAGTSAVLIAGEPGVGKTRLAGEWSRHAYEQGAVVLYGRCDEDLGAPYQPFAEALRSLVPCLGAKRLRGLRGVEALLPLVPGLTDALPDLAAPTRADPDTERYALFDAVVALLGLASTSAPVVLILDDLHWAAKPTLLLLRHLLRFGEHARVQIVGTYRSTDLDRSHPLAAMLVDLHRDGSAHRLALSGLDEGDVTAYVAEAGYDDEELARALATVTGGNPFFLIEALRHVDESGGRWDPSTLPQGVREAVSRRLSRLPAETNKALAAAAVVGSRFALALVESVVGEDLIDAFDEASKAGIVIEEPGGRYRFNHAIVRQSLLAELASVRRMRLHQKIAVTLETEPGADDELLAELAYHYFECAWAGNAAKAVEYCRRAADQAMARLAYEGAADLYDRAWHALEEIDDELPDRDDQQAELLVARCEALLAAGDVVSATGAVSQLQEAARNSGRLAAWGTCFDGQLSMLTDPERLDEIESAVGVAAEKLAGLDDAAGEAKAHTVRASCLARLGRIGDCETALDQALTAARRAREHRRANAVLAQAPLAALWGPNPVPRAGGRCLDVVRLLRITTGSPVVEATSTRCQGVLDAFRGRAGAGRQLIDSARRTLTELGMRHARLEVDQFAGIVELVADDPGSAEPHLRQAYTGFRRMGLDVDTAETAALLARACLALDRDDEADELCTESERLAGHALKPSIAWRTVRAQLLARSGAHDEGRRVAEEAVAMAERTDALVDHGDACLALATVLGTAGDAVGARAAADKAVELYELKGAAALAEKARSLLGEHELAAAPAPPETPTVELDNACVRAVRQLDAAVDREAWDEYEAVYAANVVVESRRKIVGVDLPTRQWPSVARRLAESGMVHRHAAIALRGERLALTRAATGTADVSAGAPKDEVLGLYGLDEEGRIRLAVWFDIEDMDAAVAELDAAYARLEERHPRARLENSASRGIDRYVALFADCRWDEFGTLLADGVRIEDRRQGLRGESNGRAAAVGEAQAIAALGVDRITSTPVALRGDRLCLNYIRVEASDDRVDAFHFDALTLAEMDADGLFVRRTNFDPDDFDAAIAELDARYLAGEAAAHAHTWSLIASGFAALNRREIPATSRDWVNIDHRRSTSFEPGDLPAYIRSLWDVASDVTVYIETVHRLSDFGALVSSVTRGRAHEGFDAEWREINLVTLDGELVSRTEFFDDVDIDTAIAKFEQLTQAVPRLENVASRVYERLQSCFDARDWNGLAEVMAADIHRDDRRRVVNAGAIRSREAAMADARAVAEMGARNAALTVIAIRGERLALIRSRFSGRDQQPEAFHTEALCVVEIDRDERVATYIMFDPDDIDAAIADLDARYVAGEAAAHPHAWSVIARAHGRFNRRELPATTPDWVNIDHRRVTAFAPGDLIAYIRAAWEDMPNVRARIAAVHRLSELGAVVTTATHGTSREGFDAEWLQTDVLTIKGDLLNRSETFDETDLDAALARFDELNRPAPRRLENMASRLAEGLLAHFAARDWDAMAENLAADYSSDDRRLVVGAGVRQGRDAAIENYRAMADIGFTNISSTVIATRGQRLAVTRAHATGGDPQPEAFRMELLCVAEIDTDGRIVAVVVCDVNDIDGALEELDARYLSGEAAAHAQTWSVIAGAYAALNRHELPATTPNWVSVDHQHVASIAPGDLFAAVRATWDLAPDLTTSIEAVHRLNELGGVVTHMAHGTTRAGFDAEWRQMGLMTVEGDLINRIELFDEADIDTALAEFDALSRPALQLQNTASRAYDRFNAYLAARDWDAMAEMIADDVCHDDRRRVVSSGIQQGRDAQIANLRAVVEVGVKNIESFVIAIRGERLALTRSRVSGGDHRPEAFGVELLNIVELGANNRITAAVQFDLDDIDSAFEELDAHYAAGEAAAHAHTWSVIAGVYAGFNRHELPATTPDLVTIDHRSLVTIEAGDMAANVGAVMDQLPNLSIHVETVHRLTDLGAVVSHAAHGASQSGFDAEWRMIFIYTIEGDLISRYELFDETDLDAALARFDELGRPVTRLENAATQVIERFRACFAARDWSAMAELLADDIHTDERQKVVSAGSRRGRDIDIVNTRALADIGVTNITSTVIATRGGRLALSRARMSGRDQRPDAFHTETLLVVEINADNRIVAHVAFDVDDIDAAFEELDNRYLAGQAAAEHPHTWSVIAGTYAAFNRQGLVPDWVSVDHRRGSPFVSGDLNATIRAARDLTPDLTIHIETVHRLGDLGAVVTNMSFCTSPEGFAAEWRMVQLLTVRGDRIDRIEIFDEADLDVALARFDEFSRPVRRLENAASQVSERFLARFAARDWDALAANLATDYSSDDRRRIVNAGIRQGRDAEIENLRAAADVGFTYVTSAVIATRGERLVLTRMRSSGGDQRSEAFGIGLLVVIEINAEEQIAATVVFDLDDIDAAFAELDARYLAGEAAAYSQTWTVVAGGTAALNRRELPATAPDWVAIDHRRVAAFAPGEAIAYVRAGWVLDQAITSYIEQVHRLNDFGAVFTYAAHGASQQGFDAEWRGVTMLTVEGDLLNRCEIFDEADLDAAVAKFDELDRPVPQPENAATRAYERLRAHFLARDWDALAEALADDHCGDDRRRVVNSGIRLGRDAEVASIQATADIGVASLTSVAIATRGDRLALCRIRGATSGPEAFDAELLRIVEIDADERIVARVVFDAEDISAAFDELDARYLAGEAADHAEMWSVIAQSYAAMNRYEVPTTTPDWVTVDHRKAIAFTTGGDLTEHIHSGWDVAPRATNYVEAVHRLGDRAAVYTHAAFGTSPDGFDVEWRMIALLTMLDSEPASRCELFDEADVEAALARFDELSARAPRVETTASRVAARYFEQFAARDWDAMAEILAENFWSDDRRRVVGAGVRRGRDAEITDMRAIADLGLTNARRTVVLATRGERLILSRVRFSGHDHGPEAFVTEILGIVETDADNRIAATVVFDPDDIDAAFEELDARYLAGEAAPYSHTWSVVASAYAALNRHELPATTPDWVNIDRQRLALIETGDMYTHVRAAWEVLPDWCIRVVAVDRLTEFGAVATWAAEGTSQEGFETESQGIAVLTLEGDLIKGFELFDEEDVEAAVARFDELHPEAPRLENAAALVNERLQASYEARDWDVVTNMLADDCHYDDRRHVVGAGLRHGRDVVIADLKSVADAGLTVRTTDAIATRGQRLVLSRTSWSDPDQRPEAFRTDSLLIAEIDADERLVARVFLDLDDIDAAFDELDARYLAGEAAAHAHTWSLTMQTFAGFNRRELAPTTPDWVNVDHRRGIPFAPGDMISYIRTAWDVAPDVKYTIRSVHRLNHGGAVVTAAGHGTSQQGFDAEWCEIYLLTFEDNQINRCEVFDVDDVDAALAQFDELSGQAAQLANAATRTWAAMAEAFNRRDLDGGLGLVTADGRYEDRRKGLRVEGAAREVVHPVFDAPKSWRMEVEPVAIRGSRLGLTRQRYRDTDYNDRPVTVEFLMVTTVSDAGLMHDTVGFDPDDIDAAMAELTARWIASGEVAHPHAIEAVCRLTETVNSHDWDAFATLSAGATYVNHRQLSSPGVETIADHMPSIRTMASLVPDYWVELADVLTHSPIGVVGDVVLRGASTDGLAIEIPLVMLLVVDRDRVTVFEAFDPDQRDLALARFEELNQPT